MFKVAICDDEPIICGDIENVLLNYQKYNFEEIEIEVFYSGEELCRYIEKGYSFDLIFLDIEMKTMNGVEVGKKIRQEMDDYITKIVYISGKDSYDRQLFDVQPMHFLSKPLNREKIIEDLHLAMKLLLKQRVVFSYKKGYEVLRIPIKNIIYFESFNRKIKIVTTKGEDMFYGTIDEIFSQIAKYQFIRIHRSYIINYIHVSRFKYDEVIMSSSSCLPIGQSRRSEVRKLQLAFENEG
ncbi:LytR/AlgR family response regulator transcription factor [Clostridium botulinum]|uniref:Stage 0 sporulation protein A homolog n=1 Tax=Clostridium botulinum TaxID=1491 RepID=A0A846J0G8_CLOBO|nr:LytTR family DNA-binding domain-containing protein [Clostridium botulinum]ACA55604.1 LytTr DNA-binding domain family [Clostridium botulinum A3 str. Loch Maree]NFH63885.1 response regulator transcription factor [Clostridium botulinum]NFJ07536.1 response regulator transcription factor [Clostridium botulinum]NFK14508.1 response regulator transcription factor [Clostridium botulinum]NFM93810.1 response regulator transcription factor [Clostridium botulinum]